MRIWSRQDSLARLSRMPVQWINSFRISFATLVSYIPLIATVVTCFFSLILARATLRYVEATDKGLALAREGFEREWTPDLHIKLERVSAAEANVISPTWRRVPYCCNCCSCANSRMPSPSNVAASTIHWSAV